jgi:DNA-binding PadR family transcriptional regulator
MARDDLSLFSYEILGLVGAEGSGAHDLLRMARQGRLLAWAGESQYYVEPKRLARRLGYLDAHREPGKTRERTVYTLNTKGREALRAYAQTPAQVMPLKSDALLRLLIADLVGESTTRRGVAALRGDIADLSARVDEAERRATGLPHREKYLRPVTNFLRRYLELHVELVDEVERELAPKATRGTARKRSG